MRKIILLVLVLSALDFCLGQTPEIDSLFERGQVKEIKERLKSNQFAPKDRLLIKANYYNFTKQLNEGFKTLAKLDTLKLTVEQKAYYFNILGDLYDRNTNYDLAVNHLQRAQELFLETGHELRYNEINLDLFYILLEGNFIGERTNYLDLYAKTARKLNNSNQLANLQIELAFNSLDTLDNSTFLNYFDKAFYYNSLDENPLTYGMLNAYKALFYIDVEFNKDSANAYLQKSLKIYEDLNLSNKSLLIYINFSEVERIQGNYKASIKYLKQANNYRDLSFDYDLTAFNYELLAQDYKALGQYDSAYYYLDASMKYLDSLNIEKQNIALTRFETERKEKQNLILKQENQRQQNLIYASFSGFILVIFLSFLVYKNIKRKQLIAEQAIEIQFQKNQQLLKEQELKSVDAMLMGQDRERKRIASDLHDQVGGNLASINAYFSVLKDQISDQNQREVFNTTYNLLSKTYQDIRTLAHKNNSGISAEKSLIRSIKDLKQTISQLHNIQVNLSVFNSEIKLPSYIEVSLFRMIQELSTNTIKHAEASLLDISVNVFDSSVNIIIEDNGKGFDPEQIKSSGMGLKTIEERVEALGGTFDIDTQIGRGSTFIINVNYD
ncbi:sensor histidine kinase [Psychroflexus sp. ALD_RP9]|uniref:ATP-binding protein n=1 Tax=Psychroflexus sp. ALD_RP9 TaxID=2777186 RepID=UPI001A907B62|nr:sensor histidine kinase [Psychroflexus sp. ALD_RP9]QSS96482.1 sensor histidine kinase [Psychroflexus sp. ALD_RP9]